MIRSSLHVPFAIAVPLNTDVPRNHGRRALSTTVALLFILIQSHAESKFTDPEDGAFDLSNLLLTHLGVLPVPTLITEPAVGYGLGLGLLYFTLPKKSADAPDDPKAPPNIPGLGGFATGTHSWGVGR
ncbi:hypothetical protein [Paraburkholderia fungorum]|uniref:hypothetical protein n=1 Tax=Paraburkholderia fungorum TaxID=134537 RepID=UPI0038BD1068